MEIKTSSVTDFITAIYGTDHYSMEIKKTYVRDSIIVIIVKAWISSKIDFITAWS